jgi:hypothetical protein
MSWSQLKLTDEYRRATKEVEAMISKRVAPLENEIRQLRSELIALRSQMRYSMRRRARCR